MSPSDFKGALGAKGEISGGLIGSLFVLRFQARLELL